MVVVSANSSVHATGRKFGRVNDAIREVGRELLLDHLKKLRHELTNDNLMASVAVMDRVSEMLENMFVEDEEDLEKNDLLLEE